MVIWMTSDFSSFSTVFQSYQDDRRLIMKGCVQWNSVYGAQISPLAGIELGPLAKISRPAVLKIKIR